MLDILSSFHIDWKILIAQLVNFTVVVFVLWFFALKPLAKKMQDRTVRIEDGLRQAEEVSQQLQKGEKERQEAFVAAKKEAQAIMQQAKEAAEKERAVLAEKATVQAQQILEQAKEQINQEQKKAKEELKSEISGLVILAAEKILREKLDQEKDSALAKKILQEM
ncbi:MAG: F0F1 ATP synthase subunit B [Patescibacteria group bacterium]